MDNLTTVQKVFSDHIFKIPNYQRGYAWRKQQCQDFLEDLELIDGQRQHFMGILILQNTAEPPIVDRGGLAYMTYDVIDGQQRLTTMVLLLKAICDRMETFPELSDFTYNLKRNYLLTHDRNLQPVTKSKLNQDSNGFFHDVILAQAKSSRAPAIASEERLRDALDYFSAYLDKQHKKHADAFAHWLEDFYLKIVHRLSLLIYKVSSEAEAGIIFETMNNRGKEITELEKVKNYLLYLAGQIKLEDEHPLAEEVTDTWQLIYESLMASGLGSAGNENQLLRVHWLMTYDHKAANWKGSRSVKERFDIRAHRTDLLNLLLKVQDYLNGLRAACSAYCDILRPGFDGAFADLKNEKALRRKVQKTGQRLLRVGSLAPFLPLLTAVRLKAGGENLLRALELCESYAFRVYRVARRRGNTGQSRLYRLGNNYYKSEDFDEVERTLRWTLLRYSSDALFERGFSEEDNDWYHRSGVKYLLYEYEQHLADDRGVPVQMTYDEWSRKKDSIEHIMPQTPDRGGYWSERFSAEEHQQWVHDIGNLTLTYDNSGLSNRPFNNTAVQDGKKDFYAESVFLSEREIARYEDWTLESIRKRREEIKQWALQRWHVAKPPPDPKGKKKRKPYSIAALKELADNNGVGDLFRRLLATFAEYGIGVRAYRRAINFTPPGNRRYRIGIVWPNRNHLHIRHAQWNYPRFMNISREETYAILDQRDWPDVNEENFEEYRQRLVQIFEAAGLKKSF